jgi:hypothetical protein
MVRCSIGRREATTGVPGSRAIRSKPSTRPSSSLASSCTSPSPGGISSGTTVRTRMLLVASAGGRRARGRGSRALFRVTPYRPPAPDDSGDRPTRASPPWDPKRRPNTVVVWTRSKGNSYPQALCKPFGDGVAYVLALPRHDEITGLSLTISPVRLWHLARVRVQGI